MWEAMGAPVAMSKQIEENAVDVFPENVLALQFFSDLQTQWASGMGGRERLIYSEVFALMDERGIRKKKRRLDLFWALQVMEAEALRSWQATSRKAG